MTFVALRLPVFIQFYFPFCCFFPSNCNHSPLSDYLLHLLCPPSIFYALKGAVRSILFLAVRTEMGAPLTNGNAADRRAADGAGFPFPLIDLKLVLEVSAFVSPVEAGAVHFDGVFQRLPDGITQAGAFSLRQAAARTCRQDLRGKQGFVGINVSDPRDKALIQQDRFDHPGTSLQLFKQPFGGELFPKGLDTQAAEDTFRVVSDPDPAEFPHVVEDQTGAVLEMKDHAVMFPEFFSGIRFAAEISAHAQVDQDVYGAAGKGDVDVFGTAPDGKDLCPGQQLPAFFGCSVKDQGLRIKKIDRMNLSICDWFSCHAARTKRSDDRFDFGKFRHQSEIPLSFL